MQLYPAIDLKDGKCVRLKKGDYNEVTVYSEKPYEVAAGFEQDGASFIHLVDLDGAKDGHSVNEEAIRQITETVSIPCELGGGIRTMEDIERILGLGINRVILGTVAVKNPLFVKEAVEKYGVDRIVVGVDAKNGFVATNGWEQVSDKTALSLCLAMKEYGVTTVIYTDISKDGMLVGPNVEETAKLTQKSGLNVIASGGVSCMEDLEKLADAGIKGAIMGKAIYEKRISVKDAVLKFER